MSEQEPRTKAGRELLEGFAPRPQPDAQELHRRSTQGRRDKLIPAIIAIETEAAFTPAASDGSAVPLRRRFEVALEVAKAELASAQERDIDFHNGRVSAYTAALDWYDRTRPAASDGSLDVGIGLETTRRQLSELIADAESALRHLDSLLSQTTVRVGEAGEIYRLSESPSEGQTE